MGDILSQEEVVERHETAEKLYRERLEEELVKPEQRLSPQDLVGNGSSMCAAPPSLVSAGAICCTRFCMSGWQPSNG